MSKRCKLGLILPLFVNHQKYIYIYKKNSPQTTSSWIVWRSWKNQEGNSALRHSKKCCCHGRGEYNLFPAVSSTFWLKGDNLHKIRNLSLKVLKITAPMEVSPRDNLLSRVFERPQMFLKATVQSLVGYWLKTFLHFPSSLFITFEYILTHLYLPALCASVCFSFLSL